MTHLRSFLKKTVFAIFPLPRESDTMMTGLPLFPSYFHDFRINPRESSTVSPSRFTKENAMGMPRFHEAPAFVAIL